MGSGMHLTRTIPVLLAPFIVSCVASTGADDHPATENEDLTVCASATVQGADVSEFQGSINWGAYHASGRAFAIIRAADGDGYLDPTFHQNWSGAKGAGVLRGAYQFFRASEDGTAQANVLLSQLGGDLGELPPVADVEVTDGVGPATLNANLALWMKRMQSATGKTPIVYTSPGLWPSLSGSSQFAGDTLWVADWGPSCPSLPGPWPSFKFWQYADNGSIPGIGGAVDLDVFNGTLAQLQAYAGATPPPQGPPTGKPSSPTGCGTMEPGQGLVAGQTYSSCDGRFTVAMQTDGNLVLYRNDVGATWASNTAGSDGYAAIMQGDGNFVLYGTHSDPLWASGTNGHDGATLAVQDDGNMVVYAPGAHPVWASNTNLPPPPAAPSGCTMIQPGQGLSGGEQFSSCDGRYTLAMQDDGNLVLYHNGVGAIWATMTNGKNGYNAVMQTDGNFVLYDTQNHPLWASGTSGDGGSSLAVQDDGNLVVYAPGSKPVWASNTDGK
jgi:GH25 family lysozyme M1 (1,4-beta-N-acetylmuramidase)